MKFLRKHILMSGFLLFVYFFIKESSWAGYISLHTVMETVATTLAFIIGAIALLRHYSNKNNQFLILGAGFIGTAILDLFHILVSSSWFHDKFPTTIESLSPWSWFSSRLFLGVLLYFSYLAWKKDRDYEDKSFNELTVYLLTLFFVLLVMFLFSWLPLPPAYYPDFFLHRPEEYFAGFFFTAALAGYYRKGAWKTDKFENWLLLALVVNVFIQFLYMPYSHQLYDVHFDFAHLLKITGYVFVLNGLMFNIYESFQKVKTETEERLKIQNRMQLELQQQEAQVMLQQVIDSIPVRLFWKDSEGGYLGGNLNFALDAGYRSVSEIIGKTDLDMVWKELAPRYISDDKEVLQTGQAKLNIEEPVTRTDGSTSWVNTNKVLLRDIKGGVLGVIGSYIDISKIKATEDALKRSEETFSKAQAIAHIGSWDWDIVSNSLYWSDEIYRIFGLQPQEFGATYTSFLKYIHPDDVQSVIDAVNATVADAANDYNIEHRVLRLDGEIRFVREQGKVYRDENGKPYRMIGTVNDVTEKKLAEEALVRSEQYNRMLFEMTPVGLALASMDGKLLDVNPAYANIIGRGIEETKQLSYWDITPESYSEQEAEQLRLLNKTGHYGPYEKEYIHKDGHLVPVRLSGMLLEQDGEKYIWSSVEDISESVKAKATIKYELERNEMLLRTTLDGYWIVSPEGIILDVNDSYLKMSGYTYNEFVGKSVPEIDYDQTEEEVNHNIQELINNGFVQFETRHLRKDGSILNVYVTSAFGSLEGKQFLIAFFRDITRQKITDAELEEYRENLEKLVQERTKELKDTQEELVRKERLATLGQLTATVSHELRNPLGAMKPSIYVLKKISHGDDERVAQALDRIDRNIDRCDKIIDELLDFTRITDLKPEKHDLHEMLVSILGDINIPDGIQLETLFGLDETVVCDPDRLRRAVINVTENAIQSMMDDNKNVIKDQAKLIINTGRQNGRINICVSDTGSGIPDEVLPKIFEPLFSTKGFGVGLGMPTVKQIMEQHDGGVEIETELGKGTTVILWLPDTEIENSGAGV